MGCRSNDCAALTLPEQVSQAAKRSGPVVAAIDETRSGPVVAAIDETRSGPVVAAIDETRSGPVGARAGIDAARWAALAEAVLRDERVADGELGLLFVDPRRMASLNCEHMGADGPTDVLAFPLDGAAGAAGSHGASRLIGDVVVCPARAAEQATGHRGPNHDGSLADELALLVVHGVLHVLGYDHAATADAATMQAREAQLLAAHHRTT